MKLYVIMKKCKEKNKEAMCNVYQAKIKDKIFNKSKDSCSLQSRLTTTYLFMLSIALLRHYLLQLILIFLSI